MKSLKKKYIDAKDDFMEPLNKKKKLGAFMISGMVVVLLSLFLIVPSVQANIRNSQIRTLINENIDSKKVTFLEYKTMDKVISEQKAITVLFCQPNVQLYTKVMAMLNDSNKLVEFNRGVYIYPIVYNVKKVETKYSVVATEPTLVFFENGKERSRFVITKEMDLSTEFIPAFNRLPSGNPTQTLPSSTTSEPAISTSSSEDTTMESTESSIEQVIPEEITDEVTPQ